MQVVSDDFLAEIRKSHQVISYVDVITHDNRTFRLSATDGSVQIDRTADIRRRCTVKCVDPTGDITPISAESILTPFGTELRLYRGVTYTSGVLAGATEVVPLGVFRLSKATVSDSVGGSVDISLEAYDLSRTVRRDKFTDVYTVAAGTLIVQAIKDIVGRTFPDLQFDMFASTVTNAVPLVFDADSDPWDAASSLATSIGCEIYFTATGVLKIAPPVDIDHLPAPAFTYIEGKGCTMLDLDVVFTDEPGYNGVVLTAESAGSATPPIRSVVWDSEPSSPTYHLGPYGEVPMFITNSTVTTQADADAAAAAQLNQVLGFSYQLDLTATVNPALDANDVIQVVRERSGVNAKYAVDAVTIPLMASGSSALGLRQKRTV